MPSIPSRSSKSDLPLDYVLTRPAQRSPKSHRVPSSGGLRLEASAADQVQARTGTPAFFCLSTVAAYGVIFDFEASAVVISGVRRFVAPREIQVLSALLFAEGGVVTIADVYRTCGFLAPNSVNDVVNRFIRRLRSIMATLGTIENVPGGFRFIHHAAGGPRKKT